MADIPGLIEGAHDGVGLGTHFLKHIERTGVLLHLVDVSMLDMDDITKNYDVIMNELKEFSPKMAEKTVVVAANKMDLPDARELFPDFKEAMEKRGIKVFPVSGATKEGVQELLKYLSIQLKESRKPVDINANEGEKIYEFKQPFVITPDEFEEGKWNVKGDEIERLVAMTDFANDETIARFKHKLQKMGFLDALKGLEVSCDADVFSIGEMEFEYWEFFNGN